MTDQEYDNAFERSGDERDSVLRRSEGSLLLTWPAPGEPRSDEEQELDLLKWELKQLIDAAGCRCI